MWRRRSSTAARSAAHSRVSVTSMPVPTTWVTAPSASVSAVFDHSISRSSPSRVRQWNSDPHGRLAGLERLECRNDDGALLARHQVEQPALGLEIAGAVSGELLAGSVPAHEGADGVGDDDQRGRRVEHGIQQPTVPVDGNRFARTGRHR